MENSEIPEDELEWIRQFIDDRFWRPAKSYTATAPHFYTIREWVPDQEDDFVDMVIKIRKYGHQENFYKQIYIYLYVDGFKYWTMGDTLDNTIVINRGIWSKFYGKQFVGKYAE